MFLLDANTYIHAKNLYYSFDFCPAYWDWLDTKFAAGRVASIDIVANELIAGKICFVAKRFSRKRLDKDKTFLLKQKSNTTNHLTHNQRQTTTAAYTNKSS